MTALEVISLLALTTAAGTVLGWILRGREKRRPVVTWAPGPRPEPILGYQPPAGPKGKPIPPRSGTGIVN